MAPASFRGTVWAQGEAKPRDAVALAEGALPLDRELLGNKDGSVSRAANAPRLVIGEGTIRLDDNPRSAKRPLVLSGMRLLDFQDAASDGLEKENAWTVRVASLGIPGRLVTSPAGALALLSLSTKEALGASHLLRTLPPVLYPARDASVRIRAPALVVLGDSVLEIVSEETEPAPPPAPSGLLSKHFALSLSALHRQIETPEVLEGVEDGSYDVVQVPGAEASESREGAERTAAAILRERGLPWLFIPAIVDERYPRLALAYLTDFSPSARSDARLLVSGSEPSAWVDALAAYISRGPAAIAPPRSRPERVPPPRPLEPLPVLGTLGVLQTANPAFASTINRLRAIAGTDLPIVLLGETGTGKEFVARAIHACSSRAAAPFLAVDCAALAGDGVAPEVFGSAGSDTGEARAGALAVADGGTLFLDEIGSVPIDVQASIFRALGTRCVRVAGASEERPIDVRLVAGSTRSLDELAESGALQKDLFDWLSECVFTLPPLRDRPEDLPAIVRDVLASLNPDANLTGEALLSLYDRDLPGNVRELRNVLRRALALSGGARILTPRDLGFEPGETLRPAAVAARPEAQVAEAVEGGEIEDERQTVVEVEGLHGALSIDWEDEEDSRPARSPAGAVVAVSVAPPRSVRVTFPEDIADLSDAIWREGEVVLPAEDAEESRARTRAALLRLRTAYPLAAWPAALRAQYRSLFGPSWASSENGRDVHEMLRAMGIDADNEEIREWIMGVAAHGFT